MHRADPSLAAKHTCLIFEDLTPAQLNLLRCNDGSHTHLTDAQEREHVEAGLVELVRAGGRRTRKVYRLIRQVGIRGLSCKVGSELAIAVQQREPWAQVMYANQRMQREHPSNATPIEAIYGA